MLDSRKHRAFSRSGAFWSKSLRADLTDLNHNCIIGRSLLPPQKIALCGHDHGLKPNFRDLTQVYRKRMQPVNWGRFLAPPWTDSLQA